MLTLQNLYIYYFTVVKNYFHKAIIIIILQSQRKVPFYTEKPVNLKKSVSKKKYASVHKN